MTDTNIKLTPTTRRAIGIPKLHQRLTQAANATPDVSTMEHRIALMLDVSGSMGNRDGSAGAGRSRIESLIEAVIGFINQCDYSTTALALETFGDDNPHKLPLTTFQPLLMTTVMTLCASDGTPMAGAMHFVLKTYPVTRCVLVSDGQPDSSAAALDAAGQYAEAATPIDCVHIGTNVGGEDTMRHIAELTGGLFIKFRDVASFANSFKYLTPGLRAALLGDGSEAARLLGATEVK